MADWSTLAGAVLGGGGITGVVAFARFVRDERRQRAAGKRAEEDRPLEAQVTQLGLVERATVIQQRAIESLEAQVEDQKLRYSIYKQETDERIAGLEQRVGQLQTSLRQRDEYITELHGVISGLEVQLHGRRRQAPGE